MEGKNYMLCIKSFPHFSKNARLISMNPASVFNDNLEEKSSISIGGGNTVRTDCELQWYYKYTSEVVKPKQK